MQNMAERLAENSHDIWAKKKKEELNTCGKCLILYTGPDLTVDRFDIRKFGLLISG